MKEESGNITKAESESDFDQSIPQKCWYSICSGALLIDYSRCQDSTRHFPASSLARGGSHLLTRNFFVCQLSRFFIIKRSLHIHSGCSKFQWRVLEGKLEGRLNRTLSYLPFDFIPAAVGMGIKETKGNATIQPRRPNFEVRTVTLDA